MNKIEENNYKRNANRGVPRNKKRLNSIRIKVELKSLENRNPLFIKENEPYKFKEEGYIIVLFTKSLEDYHKENWHCDYSITVKKLKEYLGEKQWSKFCQGKREFIIQRRVDGKNIKK